MEINKISSLSGDIIQLKGITVRIDNDVIRIPQIRLNVKSKEMQKLKEELNTAIQPVLNKWIKEKEIQINDIVKKG